MKEPIALLVLTTIFLFGTLWVHYKLMKAKPLVFILFSIVNLIYAYILLEGIVSLHQYLRDRGIHFQFGHADEALVELFLLWVVLVVANVVIALFRRSLMGKKLE